MKTMLTRIALCGLLLLFLPGVRAGEGGPNAEATLTPQQQTAVRAAEADLLEASGKWFEAYPVYDEVLSSADATVALRTHCLEKMLWCMVRQSYGTQPDLNLNTIAQHLETEAAKLQLTPERVNTLRNQWWASICWLKADWTTGLPFFELEWNTTKSNDPFKLWSCGRYGACLELLGKRKECLEVFQTTILDSAEVMSSGCAISLWKYISVNAPRMLELDPYADWLRRVDAIYSAKTEAEWIPFIESVRNARNGLLE